MKVPKNSLFKTFISSSSLLSANVPHPFWAALASFIHLMGLSPAICFFSLFLLQSSSLNQMAEATHMSYEHRFWMIAPMIFLYVCSFLGSFWLLYTHLKQKNYVQLISLAPFWAALVVGLFLLASFYVPVFKDYLTYLFAPFTFISQLSLLYFLIVGRIRSWYFFIFSSLIALCFSLTHAFLWLSACCLGKFIYLVVDQNWQVLRPFKPLQLVWALSFAFLLWSPMLFLILPSRYTSTYLEKRAIQSLYDATPLQQQGAEKDFEHDLTQSMDAYEKETYDKATKKLTEFKGTTKEAAATIPKEIGHIIRGSAVKAKVNMECGTLNLLCKGGKLGATVAVGAINQASQASFNRLGNQIERKLQVEMDNAEGNVNQKINAVQARLGYRINQTRRATEAFILLVKNMLLLLLLATNLIFIFIVIKSYLYVLARVIFSNRSQLSISLQESPTTMRRGNIKKCGNKYNIPASSQEHFYVSRYYEPSGRAPKLTIPQFTQGALARIRHGAYTMNKMVMEKGRSSVKFMAPGGKEFVEWTLKDGEVVMFNFKNFVAMSENIKIERKISFRISTLLLGKLFFTTATGPGKLVLSTTGSPIAGAERAAHASIPENRIIAFQQNTHFHIESELNIVDVFFSNIYLKKIGNGLVIIDADQKTKAKSGVVAFVKHFLLPV